MLYQVYVNGQKKWSGSLLTSFEPKAMAMIQYLHDEDTTVTFSSEDVELKPLAEKNHRYTLTFIMPEKDVYVTAVETKKDITS